MLKCKIYFTFVLSKTFKQPRYDKGITTSPTVLRKIGWIILIPTLLLGVLMLIDGFNGYPTYLMPAQGTACYETLCSIATTGRALNNIALVGICIGGIFVACSANGSRMK